MLFVKYKSIALFCAFTIAAVLAVATTGFAKDASPPGREFVQPNVTCDMPSVLVFDAPLVVHQEVTNFAVRGNPVIVEPVLSVKTRPPSQARFDSSINTDVKPFSGARCSTRPDH